MSLNLLFDPERQGVSSALEAIFESIPTGVIILEKTNETIVYVNDHFVEISGFNPKGLSFKDYALNTAKVRKPDSHPFLYEQLPLAKALLGKITQNEQIVIQRPDEKTLTIVVNAKPLTNDKGEVTGAIAILEDITERVKAEEELKKSKENYRHLLEYAPTAIFEIDYRKPRLTGVNEATCRIMGYSEQELLTTNIFGLLEPESAERLKDIIRRGLAGEKIERNVEFKVITKDGRHLWAMLHVKPIYRGGKPDTALVVGYDVTERRKAEEKFSKAFKYSPNAITITRLSDGRIIDGNDSVTDLLGFVREEAVGKTTLELGIWINPDDRIDFVKTLSEKGFVSGQDLALRRKDGTQITVNLSGALIEIGNEQCLLSSFIDITARKKVEEALNQRNRELEQLKAKLEEKAAEVKEYSLHMEQLAEERLKKLKNSEHLATIGAVAGMVGHDIRNPLQAIMGDLYLAKQELGTFPTFSPRETALECLDEIERSVDYINKIVADLQDYSRTLAPTSKEVDIDSVFDSVLIEKAIPDSLEVCRKVDTEASKLIADPDLLKRALSNLVNNAIQAMPKGGKLTLCSYREDNNFVITVEDTGSGIPDVIKPKLFTPLFTTKAKGQGFGLAVVKRMTEAQGGTVSFESESGCGTKFIVRLPNAILGKDLGIEQGLT